MKGKKKANHKKPFILFLILLVLSAIVAFSHSFNRHPTQNSPTEDFIATIGNDARAIGHEYGVYASVLIAQAILESDSGTSTLSNPPYYNLFGIKGSYQGNSIQFETLEDDGTGANYTITDSFKVYPSAYASMVDYAQLIRTDTYYNAWKENTLTYHDATATLTGLYATDTSYGNKLNQLIEQYHLTQFD